MSGEGGGLGREGKGPDPGLARLSTLGPTTHPFLKLCQESDTASLGENRAAEPTSCQRFLPGPQLPAQWGPRGFPAPHNSTLQTELGGAPWSSWGFLKARVHVHSELLLPLRRKLSVHKCLGEGPELRGVGQGLCRDWERRGE